MTVEKDKKDSVERTDVDRRAFIGGLGALCASGAWSPSHRLWASESPSGCPVPPGFPPGIDVFLQAFQNWTREITIDQLWTCQPQTPEDVVTLANWARKQGYTLRPRGFMHNWSPIAVTPDTTCADRVVLMDLTTNLRSMAISSVDPALRRAISRSVVCLPLEGTARVFLKSVSLARRGKPMAR
jgi:hypothetical protein